MPRGQTADCPGLTPDEADCWAAQSGASNGGRRGDGRIVESKELSLPLEENTTSLCQLLMPKGVGQLCSSFCHTPSVSVIRFCQPCLSQAFKACLLKAPPTSLVPDSGPASCKRLFHVPCSSSAQQPAGSLYTDHITAQHQTQTKKSNS